MVAHKVKIAHCIPHEVVHQVVSVDVIIVPATRPYRVTVCRVKMNTDKGWAVRKGATHPMLPRCQRQSSGTVV